MSPKPKRRRRARQLVAKLQHRKRSPVPEPEIPRPFVRGSTLHVGTSNGGDPLPWLQVW